MCLYPDREETEHVFKLYEKAPAAGLRFWKVVKRVDDALVSPYCVLFLWRPGRNAAKGHIAPLATSLRRYHTRRLGLHLYRARATADEHVRAWSLGGALAIIPVRVAKADFVAANKYEVLARAAHLSKAAYDKALKATAPV